ncbi:hypothetical protein SeMB42_g00126 [Synchytrium endobioticum]|uniref:C2H2-type domain-containing protein n=1 Tax=Synchytrium endobioticum TaxID=286115 RepID=A0A507DTN8_9FUNG|nr:hypothetical protein SeLEV6574_g00220 [Synchytrium endobioticum]TPX54906.1 hypothetical protein SeMB42_g00126 [Synchytrium endobioticum]
MSSMMPPPSMPPPQERRQSLIPLCTPLDFSALLASRRRSSFSLGLWGSLGSIDEPVIQTVNSSPTHSTWSFTTPASPPPPPPLFNNNNNNHYGPYKSITYRPGKLNPLSTSINNSNCNSHVAMPCTSVAFDGNQDQNDHQHTITCCSTTFSTVVDYFDHVNHAHPQQQTPHTDPLGNDDIDDQDSDTPDKSDRTWNRLVVNLIADDEPPMVGPPPPRHSSGDTHIRRVSAQFDAMRLDKPYQECLSSLRLASDEMQRDDFLESVFDSDDDENLPLIIKDEPVSPAISTSTITTTAVSLKTPPDSGSDENDDDTMYVPMMKRAREPSLIVTENKKQKSDEWHAGGLVGAPSNNINNKSRTDHCMVMSASNTNAMIEADYNSFIHQQQQQQLAAARAAQMILTHQYVQSPQPAHQLFDVSNHTMSPAALHAPHYQSNVMMPASVLSQVPSILSPNYSDSLSASPRQTCDADDGELDDALGELDDEWMPPYQIPVRPGSAPPVQIAAPGTESIVATRGRAIERIRSQQTSAKSLSLVRSVSPGSRMTETKGGTVIVSVKRENGATSPKRLYRCPKPYCSKVYKNSNGLKYHLERGQCEADNSDADEGLPEDIRIAVRPYYCRAEGCGKRYKNLNGLKYHAKVAHPGVDFKSRIKGHLPPFQ